MGFWSDNFGSYLCIHFRPLVALAIPTIQASLAAVHDYQRLGAALVAHAGAGREAAVVGAFGVGFGGDGNIKGYPSPARPSGVG